MGYYNTKLSYFHSGWDSIKISIKFCYNYLHKAMRKKKQVSILQSKRAKIGPRNQTWGRNGSRIEQAHQLFSKT